MRTVFRKYNTIIACLLAIAPWCDGMASKHRTLSGNDTLAGVHLVMDRPVYKPGDSVRFHGVLRGRTGGTGTLFPIAGKTLLFTPAPPTEGDDEAVTLHAITDSLGGFAGGFRLPDAAETGFWQWEIRPVGPSRADLRRAEALADSTGQEPGRFIFTDHLIPFRVTTRQTPLWGVPNFLFVSELCRLTHGTRKDGATTPTMVWQQTSIPFSIRPGEQIVLTLPKSLYDALRKSRETDTSFYWMPDPARRITRLCEGITLDTTADAWNALLHYLKNQLVHSRSQQTNAAYNRLRRYLTDEGGFGKRKGRPADATVTLAIAEAMAANVLNEQTVRTLLRRNLLPYLEQATPYGRTEADTFGRPDATRLRYLYSAALVYGPAADRHTAAFNHDLQAFAENIDLYPIHVGIYGLYSLYLHGDTALFENSLPHYDFAACYNSKQKTDLRTATLIYRLLMNLSERAAAAELSYWIGFQNRTHAIETLTLAYNERLFPLPAWTDTTPASWQLHGQRLTVDWHAAADSTTETDTVLPCAYGTLTFGFTSSETPRNKPRPARTSRRRICG